MARDEFTKHVQRTLAQRVAYLCSNPACRALTIGPNVDLNKATLTGTASHICAASPKGPRYDSTQTPAERKGIANGLWLCHSCGDRVDHDMTAFSPDQLRSWKEDTEAYVGRRGMIPSLPLVSLETLDGHTVPIPEGGQILPEHFATLREQRLQITNDWDRPIHDLQLRIQFPEALFASPAIDSPPGVSVSVSVVVLPVRTAGRGTLNVRRIDAARVYKVGVDRIPAKRTVVVRLLSREPRFRVGFPGPPELSERSDALLHYMRGSYQFEVLGAFRTQEFVVPLRYEAEQRRVVSEPVAGWQGQPVSVFYSIGD